MNRLVEYLSEYHNPGGNSFKIVLTSEILEETDFTVEELHALAMMPTLKK